VNGNRFTLRHECVVMIRTTTNVPSGHVSRTTLTLRLSVKKKKTNLPAEVFSLLQCFTAFVGG